MGDKTLNPILPLKATETQESVVNPHYWSVALRPNVEVSRLPRQVDLQARVARMKRSGIRDHSPNFPVSNISAGVAQFWGNHPRRT
jgi:hypothetical protein